MLEFGLFSLNFFVIIALLFARIGTAIMLFPGIGDLYVPPRLRLVFALSICFLLEPILKPYITPVPSEILNLFFLILIEIIIGVFLGTIIKILANIMSVAGNVIATQTGLGSAMLFDPNQGTQGVIIANFLGLIAVVLIFETGIDHIFISGLVDTYNIFPAFKVPDPGKMSEMIVGLVAGSFEAAIKISAPQIIIALVFFLGAGILSRLMPSMQIFFVLAPAQLLIGFFVLMLTLSGAMLYFVNYSEDILSKIF